MVEIQAIGVIQGEPSRERDADLKGTVAAKRWQNTNATVDGGYGKLGQGSTIDREANGLAAPAVFRAKGVTGFARKICPVRQRRRSDLPLQKGERVGVDVANLSTFAELTDHTARGLGADGFDETLLIGIAGHHANLGARVSYFGKLVCAVPSCALIRLGGDRGPAAAAVAGSLPGVGAGG